MVPIPSSPRVWDHSPLSKHVSPLDTPRLFQVEVASEADQTGGPVDRNPLAGADLLSRLGYADDGRDAVLAGDHSPVGVGATHLHHQSAGSEEERRPAGICRRGNEDLARFEVRA